MSVLRRGLSAVALFLLQRLLRGPVLTGVQSLVYYCSLNECSLWWDAAARRGAITGSEAESLAVGATE
jgi:hypothetical protein